MQHDVIVIGGGAAGFFGAIQCAERNPSLKILILEKGLKVLQKVKVSGGGRCNVTHACYNPSELVQYYPRGNKELLGPFNQFACGDMMAWLDEKGVPTKIEDDGRTFPASNKSQTIIDCFERLTTKFNIEIKLQQNVVDVFNKEKLWHIQSKTSIYKAKNIIVAAGSSNAIWSNLKKLGHNIIKPVPSLFTFNIKHSIINDLMGIVLPQTEVEIVETNFKENGPVLITHWGLSGPGILKLSSIAARELYGKKYEFKIVVNWISEKQSEVEQKLKELRNTFSNKLVANEIPYKIPKRFWKNGCTYLQIADKKWATVSNKEIVKLATALCNCELPVKGKSTFKEEFVTSGGVDLKEINFKTMESKILPNMYFAGEILNIDALTGGFNFQAAWTTAWLSAKNIALAQN